MEITYQMAKWPVTSHVFRDEELFAIITTPRRIFPDITDAANIAFPFNSQTGDDVISISCRYGDWVPDTIRSMAQLERRPM